jgi:D-alanyl-lipoteichoic acid acyltransferase DltB (MBOAT superfamily)
LKRSLLLRLHCAPQQATTYAVLLWCFLAPLQDRVELSLPASCYNLPTYLAYTMYLPLYIAGPIASFNSFASQLQVGHKH